MSGTQKGAVHSARCVNTAPAESVAYTQHFTLTKALEVGHLG